MALVIRLIINAFLFALSLPPAAGLAQSQAGWVDLGIAKSSHEYKEIAVDEKLETTSEVSEGKYLSDVLRFSLGIKASEVLVRYSKVTDSNFDYWSEHEQLSADIIYHFSGLRWISPIIGLAQTSQTASTSTNLPPVAFVTINRLLALGVNIELIPLVFGGKHQILFRSSYRYLTALDTLGNQGTEAEAGLGYLFPLGRITTGLEFTWNVSEIAARRETDENSDPHPFRIDTKTTSLAVLIPIRVEWNSSGPARKF
jgi:hypothetical protein